MFSSYDLKSYGLTLKRIRKQLAFTQETVSEKTQISRDTLRRIENGLVVPRFETLERLSFFYKTDLLKILSEHRTDAKLQFWYDELDALITNYTEQKFLAIQESIKEYTQLNFTHFITPEEIRQCLIFLDAIKLYFTNITTQSYKIEELLIQCMKITISEFDINQYKKFRYNIIETRILLLISLLYSNNNLYEKSNALLYFLIRHHRKNMILPVKHLISIYTNIAYNHHMEDQHEKVITISKIGIDMAVKHDTFSRLYLLYFRKGIAEFKLNKPDYVTSLTLSLSILKILGQNDLYQRYHSVLEHQYHILLPNL